MKKAREIVLLDVGLGKKLTKKQSSYAILTRKVEARKHIPICCSLSFSFYLVLVLDSTHWRIWFERGLNGHLSLCKLQLICSEKDVCAIPLWFSSPSPVGGWTTQIYFASSSSFILVGTCLQLGPRGAEI